MTTIDLLALHTSQIAYTRKKREMSDEIDGEVYCNILVSLVPQSVGELMLQYALLIYGQFYFVLKYWV